MTYNPDDWQLGDLVIMELDLSRVIASDDAKKRNRGREVRMLVNRDIGSQGRRHDVWQGKHGSVRKMLRDPRAVVYIERMFAVDQPTLNRVNQMQGHVLTIPAGMVIGRDTNITRVATPEELTITESYQQSGG